MLVTLVQFLGLVGDETFTCERFDSRTRARPGGDCAGKWAAIRIRFPTFSRTIFAPDVARGSSSWERRVIGGSSGSQHYVPTSGRAGTDAGHVRFGGLGIGGHGVVVPKESRRRSKRPIYQEAKLPFDLRGSNGNSLVGRQRLLERCQRAAALAGLTALLAEGALMPWPSRTNIETASSRARKVEESQGRWRGRAACEACLGQLSLFIFFTSSFLHEFCPL